MTSEKKLVTVDLCGYETVDLAKYELFNALRNAAIYGMTTRFENDGAVIAVMTPGKDAQ